MGHLLSRLSRACILLTLLVGLAQAAEPTLSPLPRLETGMHTAPIIRIATDAAGRWAVTASDDKTARVWDVASGRLLQVLRPPQDVGNEGKLYAVAMSPDGETVAVGGWTGWDWYRQHSIYLFDRASGQLLRRIAGLPNVIGHLAWSPDGRWLAASLGEGGVRVFDAASGHETDRDADYGGDSYSVQFSPLSTTAPLRLLTTCLDGQVRLYRVDQHGRLSKPQTARPGGGQRPFAARFSPDGQRIALGYDDSTTVQVLEADTLAASTVPPYARLDLSGVDIGNLGNVAWTRDGRLLAAGRWDVAGKNPARMWDLAAGGGYRDLPLADTTIMDLVPLADGGLLFAAGDPAWGVLDGAGQILRRRDGDLADLRAQEKFLGVSADGRQVRFGYKVWGKEPKVFDLARRALVADDPGLPAPRTQADGLKVENWEDRTDPRLNGQPLALEPYETAFSLAVAADGRDFILGTHWLLRRYDRAGGLVWQQAVPGAVWAVNLSADGRFVVAAYGDGTIRWHRFSDGQEILALFPHADQQRWIAWTPEGYFAASPGAEELFGYHLNHGPDREGQFVAARQLWEAFYQPDLISHRLDADGDQRLAAQVKKTGDIRALLAQGTPPELELLSPTEGECSVPCTLRVRIKNPGQGKGRLVVRVEEKDLGERWSAPPLTPGGVVELPLDLAEGLRRISVELVDGRKIGSKPLPLQRTVRNANRLDTATLHVLAVGVSNYRDGDLRLKHAAADATALAKRLMERGSPQFQGRVVTRTLLDREATAANIGKTLKEMAARARPQDVFVLFLAGHGTTLEGEYFFMPWEFDYENDAALRRQAISQDQLKQWQNLLPTRSLTLLDTCRAGAALAGRTAEDKDALAKVIRVSQRNMIVASSSSQIALEGYKGHGVFSWVVLDALRRADYDVNGQVDTTDIATHVRKEVPAITEKVFKLRQVPMQDTPGEPFAVAKPE